MQEMKKMRVQSLGGEDPLEEEMATHSSILTMDREAWRATVHGVPKEWDVTEPPSRHIHPGVLP